MLNRRRVLYPAVTSKSIDCQMPEASPQLLLIVDELTCVRCLRPQRYLSAAAQYRANKMRRGKLFISSDLEVKR